MNKTYQRYISLLLMVTIIFTQGGCWSRKEIDGLAIVLAAGIDRTPEGKIHLTVQIARPRAFGGGGGKPSGVEENNVWFISQTGDTVLDAQRFLETKVSRKIYWGHNVILVIGEEMARQGIRQAINFFSRSPDARETIWVLVAKGKASDVLNSHSQLENTSAQSTGFLIRSGVGVPVMLKDLSMMLASKGTNPILPRIEVTPSGEAQGAGLKENIPEDKGSGQEGKGMHGEVTIAGTGIFKDERLVGWLNLQETRGLLWLKNQMEKGIITIPSLTDPDKKVSIKLIRGSTKVEPFYDGENIRFDIKIKMEGDFLEQQSTEDLTDPKIFKAFEVELANAIKESTQSTLTKVQSDYGVDAFSYGEVFHRKYKKEWVTLQNRWDEEFARAEVNIRVEANIRRTGITTNRASSPE